MGKAIIIDGDFSSLSLGSVTFVSGIIEIEAITITNKPSTITNSHQLSRSLTPSNTTQTLVVWETSNASIATVSASGLVTVLQSGTVTITCRSYYNAAVFDSVTVTAVKELIPVTSISLSAPKTELAFNEQLTISISKLPLNAETGLTISSVTTTGVVSIVSNTDSQIIITSATTEGAWSVTATTSNGVSNSISGSVNNIEVISIELTADHTDFTVGTQLLISVVKTPSDATVGTAMTYTKTGPIEFVNEYDHEVQIISTGEGDWSVTGTTANGKTDTIFGRCIHNPLLSIDLTAPKSNIVVGEQLTITATRTPSNATNDLVTTWTVSGPISISSSTNSQAIITATGLGAFTVTATTNNNSITDSFSGNVIEIAITSATLTETKASPWEVGDSVTVTANVLPSGAGLTNFTIVLTGTGASVSSQTQTSLTISANAAGSAIVTAYDGATQLATKTYTISEPVVSDPNLVYQLDASNYTSGSTWTPTIGTNNAEVAGGVKTGDMVRFHDTVSGSTADIYLRINLSPDVNNTGDWTVYFEGYVPPLLTTGAGEAINYIIALQNGTSYKQAIGVTQDSTGIQPNAVMKLKAFGDDGTTTAIAAGKPFVNKMALVKNAGKFDAYLLNNDNTISYISQWLIGTSSVYTAFLANASLNLVNRRMESYYAVFADNSVKQIKVYDRAFNLTDVEALFGV